MKNTLIAIALATAGFLAAPIPARPLTRADSSSTATVGQSNVSEKLYDDDDTAFAGNIGYRWAVAPSVLIGIEGGYTDLGKFSPKARCSASAMRARRLDARRQRSFQRHRKLVHEWPRRLVQRRHQGRLPRHRRRRRSRRRHQEQWYAGAGFGYDFNTNFSVGLNYDYYQADKNNLDLSPDLVSVSAEYRF